MLGRRASNYALSYFMALAINCVLVLKRTGTPEVTADLKTDKKDTGDARKGNEETKTKTIIKHVMYED